jgi:RNA polymerase sigma factor (sigma-70 family)
LDSEILAGIVRRAQKGDSHAQQELYLESSKSVYYLALRILRNPEDAEDITHDVFMMVFEKIPELKQPAAYQRWLNQITANKCMDFLRLNKSVHTDELDILDTLEQEDEEVSHIPDKLYDDEETRRLILEIIDTLPDAQRICVMYRYVNQLSVEEIAVITATNEHTVKSRLALARNKIRAAILEKEDQEGIRLHVIIPIMPVLMKSLEDFQMPEGLTAQMWERIAEGAGIVGAGTIAAATSGQVGPKLAEAVTQGATEAASEAVKAGATEAVKNIVTAKVIGIVAGAAAVIVTGVVLVTTLVLPEIELPAQVVTPPGSTIEGNYSTGTPTTTPTETPTQTAEPTPSLSPTPEPSPTPTATEPGPGFSGYGDWEYQFGGNTYRYDGEWKDGKPNGQGSVAIAFENVEIAISQTLTGTFVDGLCHGKITSTVVYSDSTTAEELDVNMGARVDAPGGIDWGMPPWMYGGSPW